MGLFDIFKKKTDNTVSPNKVAPETLAKPGITENQISKKELVEKLMLNVYDSALLAQDNLKGEKLVKFLERTTELTGMNL